MNERLVVRQFVQQLLRAKGDSADVGDGDSLVVSGRLASIDTLELVIFLEEQYGVDFAERGFDQYKLDSVDNIMTMIAGR